MRIDEPITQSQPRTSWLLKGLTAIMAQLQKTTSVPGDGREHHLGGKASAIVAALVALFAAFLATPLAQCSGKADIESTDSNWLDNLAGAIRSFQQQMQDVFPQLEDEVALGLVPTSTGFTISLSSGSLDTSSVQPQLVRTPAKSNQLITSFPPWVAALLASMEPLCAADFRSIEFDQQPSSDNETMTELRSLVRAEFCSSLTSCAACLENNKCGWCDSEATCMPKATGTCSSWATTCPCLFLCLLIDSSLRMLIHISM